MATQPHSDPLDALVTDGRREGLTGTAPATVYAPVREFDQFTIAPDGRPLEDQPAWRRDFPIDFPQDDYVARRDFVKFMVLTSLGLAVGQLWIAFRQWWRGGGAPAGERRLIADASGLSVGGSLVFDYPGPTDPCVLVRVSDAEWVAYSQKCTHLSCAVIPQPDRGVFNCPCHEGVFELRTGRPLAGPPRRPLPRVTLSVENGRVYATGIEYRTV
jgi:nitrite reductase/ring-hydroxylating ferredoxin subunit